MSLAALVPILLFVAAAAGFLGSLTGLGGGVVIIPALVILLGVDLRLAIGASLVAVIATSCGAAAAYVREGWTNVRVGVLLEVATTLGAVAGALIAAHVSKPAIASVFVAVLFWSAWSALRPPPPKPIDDTPDDLATRLRLDSTMPGKDGPVPYRVHNVSGALGVMLGAGALSALVGVGSGVVKVVAMDRMMRLPFKVSTTTSNFMIGVTAAASTGVYLHRGQVEPTLAAPVALGALAGSVAGARVLTRLKIPLLRKVFAGVVVLSGLELTRRIATGAL